MKHYTTKYILRKNNDVLEFMSEKDACEFLGVKKCSVASCYRCGTKCKGYTIERVGITTHHATKTRMYKIWQSMHERCEREKHEHYENYGGRGITVCEEWREFEPFRDWAVASGYSDKLSIDRINTDGNYCPENCRWVTMKEQQNNKRNNRRITYNGETHTITEWSEITGIKKTTIKERLNMSWSNEKTLTTPVRQRAIGYIPYKAKMDLEE